MTNPYPWTDGEILYSADLNLINTTPVLDLCAGKTPTAGSWTVTTPTSLTNITDNDTTTSSVMGETEGTTNAFVLIDLGSLRTIRRVFYKLAHVNYGATAGTSYIEISPDDVSYTQATVLTSGAGWATISATLNVPTQASAQTRYVRFRQFGGNGIQFKAFALEVYSC